MKVLDVRHAARDAVAANPTRPATAIVHDALGARLLVFRIEPGQRVAAHTSPSTVALSVLAGKGLVSGTDGERLVRAGDLVVYEDSWGFMEVAVSGGNAAQLLRTGSGDALSVRAATA